ncbi:MAG: quinone-dependent dihydroorotate dehydrogenase [Pseudomonadota bacterium]|nr:quinone-dependent dihydroorotate dehydrogenase [Pseudomonadota bacterium]
MEPEAAHRLALAGLRLGLSGQVQRDNHRALTIEALGRHFSNPIGLAAGFDKDGVALTGLGRLGFGFVETGTITLRPQVGNKRPRLFRLEPDRALINRMGFNNAGVINYLTHLRRERREEIPIGANVGINRVGADPERDFPALVAAVAPFVDYAVINVSSPNTPGLRAMQGEDRLRAVLRAITEGVPHRPPILVKISPDLPETDLAGVVEACVENGVQGLIVSNTTTCRPPNLVSPQARETGGLSGAPLFRPSTAKLARAFLLARGRLCFVGVGGVFTGRDALTKIQAGASLVQLYTAFAYAGPALIPRLKSEFATAMHAEGFERVQDAIGTAADRLAGSA